MLIAYVEAMLPEHWCYFLSVSECQKFSNRTVNAPRQPPVGTHHLFLIPLLKRATQYHLHVPILNFTGPGVRAPVYHDPQAARL